MVTIASRGKSTVYGPFRKIRRQPDLRRFSSALIVDQLDPVDDEGRSR
jgi:hypothetical protein